MPSPDDSTFYIRVMLVRDHEGFTHIPVDQVCEKHDEGDKLKRHVLRYSKGDPFAFNTTFINGLGRCLHHRDTGIPDILQLCFSFTFSDYNFYPAIYVNGYRPSIVVEVAHIISFTNSYIIQLRSHSTYK